MLESMVLSLRTAVEDLKQNGFLKDQEMLRLAKRVAELESSILKVNVRSNGECINNLIDRVAELESSILKGVIVDNVLTTKKLTERIEELESSLKVSHEHLSERIGDNYSEHFKRIEELEKENKHLKEYFEGVKDSMNARYYRCKNAIKELGGEV